MYLQRINIKISFNYEFSEKIGGKNNKGFMKNRWEVLNQ